MKKYILSLVVQNNFGVLARISSLFARRGYNIDSISASPTNNPKITKITVVVEADDEIIEKVFKQVSKLEEVYRLYEPQATSRKDLEWTCLERLSSLLGRDGMYGKGKQGAPHHCEAENWCDFYWGTTIPHEQ